MKHLLGTRSTKSKGPEAENAEIFRSQEGGPHGAEQRDVRMRGETGKSQVRQGLCRTELIFNAVCVHK